MYIVELMVLNVFKDTSSTTLVVQHWLINCRMIMSEELGGIWKEVVIA